MATFDADFIRDLFAQFRPVTVRRMFSGAGLYCDGVMFGLVVRGAIYLKADDTSIADFEREGCGPFTYTRGKKSGRPSEHALPYWRLPDRLYDDPDELALWAERALALAQRQKLASPKRAKRKPKTQRLTKNSADRHRSRA
ncbi:MAG TPA: TfoX/Sxy family protein [Xanthobacteraceae bacterium]|nr:TfoX/Sxy family protein [Xanthobacteraceae bacterium]